MRMAHSVVGNERSLAVTALVVAYLAALQGWSRAGSPNTVSFGGAKLFTMASSPSGTVFLAYAEGGLQVGRCAQALGQAV